ncbi:MAG: hypothetical protein WBX25_20930 [Rhodomicrobium sp.]
MKSLPQSKCAWCLNPMHRERSTRFTCSDACRAALYRTNRARNKHDMSAGLAHKQQTAAPARKAPVPRRIDIRDLPKGDGCTFKATWPDGFEIEIQVTRDTVMLTAAEWIEEITLTPDGKQFVCTGCQRPTPILQEGPEQFLCAECIAQHERR